MNAKYIFGTVISITLLLLVGGWFYWFEYRPIEVKAFCVDLANEAARQDLVSKNTIANGVLGELVGQGMFLREDQQAYYEECLNRHGVK